MTSTDPVPRQGAGRAPRVRRDPGRKAIAGVAAGLAEHLGIDVKWLRLGFVALTFLDGFGILLYALLWLLVPAGDAEEPAGLESARRLGLRPSSREQGVDSGVLVSVGFIVAGMLGVVAGGGAVVPPAFFWPLVISGVGVLLLWLQADRASGPVPTTAAGFWMRLTRGAGAASIARLIGGLLLVGLGSSWILASQIGLSELPQVLGAALALLGGVLVVTAPWLYRMRQRARDAEQKRVRAEARSDMAAHLHDSVLQTLALIQRQADDPAAVALLARRQERELRTWLYGSATTEQTLKGALERIRSDVEGSFPIKVEVVCVGDAGLDDAGRALVQAAGEAVTNAAKHSGADRVDVYAEVEEDRIEVFVRDRGAGFDADQVRPDRMGVRESIRARMERAGGTARIRTAPGRGTEVVLEMKR